MVDDPVSITLESARRLAVANQHLAGRPAARVTSAQVRSVIRDLAYVQWDPVTVVAPSHMLSLRARLDHFTDAALDRLLWKERTVFEHWTPMASLVLTEDYPIFASLMARYPDSLSDSWGRQRGSAKKFLAENEPLRRTILRELEGGPRRLSDFAHHAGTKRRPTDWAPSSDVAEMLYHLTMTGKVMVVGHEGAQNLWGLSDRFLPSRVERSPLPEAEADRAAALRAIHALGTASAREVHTYFVRGRYRNAERTLGELQERSQIRTVRVEGLPERTARYIRPEDVRRAEQLDGAAWSPRMSLLPPFDNMLYSQARGQKLFAFDYVREQFLPPAQRRFGTYVLPILRGSSFIGRIDPRFDKARRTLVINAVHAEPGAPGGPEVTRELGTAIGRLARSIGARAVRLPPRLPAPWRRLRA